MHQQREHISRPLMFRTPRGQLVTVWLAMAADTLLLAELLCRLSERTRHLRYMSSRHFSGEAIWKEAVRMARGPASDHTTLIATIRLNENDEAVAIAELVRNRHDLTVGEIALVVRDDEQRQGIGSFLLRHLVRIAQRGGITSLSANMLAENSAMLHLIRTLGLAYTATTRYGETQAVISLPEYHQEIGLARRAHKLAA
ncbi:MAG TPA: GNAT family N-acetyltransferase [Roseiflexaceae bacterium]|nr:GNAT family N-acetyltransferase [Roseiflexaceae bacterium]